MLWIRITLIRIRIWLITLTTENVNDFSQKHTNQIPNQSLGSVTFWYGSGSKDPYLWLTDPDANSGGPKTYRSYGSGSGCGFGTLVHYIILQKEQRHKEVIKQYKSRFFLLFFLMMEGSGAGSVLVTNGSGSPTLTKTLWNLSILWMKISRPVLEDRWEAASHRRRRCDPTEIPRALK